MSTLAVAVAVTVAVAAGIIVCILFLYFDMARHPQPNVMLKWKCLQYF